MTGMPDKPPSKNQHQQHDRKLVPLPRKTVVAERFDQMSGGAGFRFALA